MDEIIELKRQHREIRGLLDSTGERCLVLASVSIVLTRLYSLEFWMTNVSFRTQELIIAFGGTAVTTMGGMSWAWRGCGSGTEKFSSARGPICREM